MLRVAPRALCVGKAWGTRSANSKEEEDRMSNREIEGTVAVANSASASGVHVEMCEDSEAEVCNGLVLSDGRRIRARHVALAP